MDHTALKQRIAARHHRNRKGYRFIPAAGRYLIGYTERGHAVALYLDNGGHVDRDALVAMYEEATERTPGKPLHVYASTTGLGETPTFIFYQLDQDQQPETAPDQAMFSQALAPVF